MKLLRSHDVMDIAPTTGEEAPIFAAAKRYPDPIFGHCGLSSAFLPHSGAGQRRSRSYNSCSGRSCPSRPCAARYHGTTPDPAKGLAGSREILVSVDESAVTPSWEN